jgi:EamA domain-containing membrane protein RarD
VTSGRRYLAGVLLVAAGGGGLAAMLPRDVRLGVASGVVIGVVLQAPLGWWVVRSIGTARFMAVWGLGMLTRLSLVAVVSAVALSALGARAAVVLMAMVGVFVALLAVEGVTALREHSRENEQ